EKAIPLIGRLRATETCVLTHGPQPAAIHRRMNTAGERVLTGLSDALLVRLRAIAFTQLDTGGRSSSRTREVLLFSHASCSPPNIGLRPSRCARAPSCASGLLHTACWISASRRSVGSSTWSPDSNRNDSFDPRTATGEFSPIR